MECLHPTRDSKFFSWKIVNFNLCSQLLGEPICSPNFSLDSTGTMFSLYLYPRGSGKREKHFSVKLKRHKSDFEHLFQCKYELRLRIVENGKEKSEKILCIDFTKPYKIMWWTWPYLDEDDIESNIPIVDRKNDLLLYNLDIYLKIIPTVSAPDSIWTSQYTDLLRLSSDLKYRKRVSMYCDLNFDVSGDALFEAHKAIISSRYPKLASALGLSGEQSQKFQFCTDCETLEVLLNYLYTGEIEVSNVPSGIYDLLDNVKLPHLKNLLFHVPNKISATTNICTRQCDFTWRIPSFCSLQENIKLHYNFCCDELLKWTNMKILFYLTHNDKNEQYVAFSVRRIFSGGTIRMKCRISFVEAAFFHKEYDHIFENEIEWKIPEFVKKRVLIDNKDLYLRKDILRIKFEFIISNGTYTSDICTVRFPENNITNNDLVARDYWTLQQDLSRLYKNPVFSDVTLCVGGKEFPAHKVILSHRSETFLDIFNKETEEERSSKLVIEDFDPPVIQAILSYIYSGEVSNKRIDFEFVSNLYAAAVKYRLLFLMRKCQQYFKRVLCVKNAGDILLLADVHCSSILKKYVHDFVLSNAEDILSSREWKRIMGANLHLAEELLHILLTSKIK